MVFYIGFPRTATTYLQTLFYLHPGIRYLHKTRRLYRGEGYPETAEPGRITVEGDESLSTDLALPVAEKLRRIRDADAGARVILSIRKQSEVLRSWFHHALLRDGSIHDLETLMRSRAAARLVAGMRYARTVAAARDLLGVERVLVLVYDELERDRAAYRRRVESFLGLVEALDRPEASGERRVNRSLSPISINALCAANRLAARLRPSPAAAVAENGAPGLTKVDFLRDRDGYRGTQRRQRILRRYLLEPLDAVLLRRLSRWLDVRTIDTTGIMDDFRGDNEKLSGLIGEDLIRLWH